MLRQTECVLPCALYAYGEKVCQRQKDSVKFFFVRNVASLAVQKTEAGVRFPVGVLSQPSLSPHLVPRFETSFSCCTDVKRRDNENRWWLDLINLFLLSCPYVAFLIVLGEIDCSVSREILHLAKRTLRSYIV